MCNDIMRMKGVLRTAFTVFSMCLLWICVLFIRRFFSNKQLRDNSFRSARVIQQYQNWIGLYLAAIKMVFCTKQQIHYEHNIKIIKIKLFFVRTYLNFVLFVLFFLLLFICAVFAEKEILFFFRLYAHFIEY